MQPDPNQRSRENMLAVTLTMVGGGMILFFLYLISFGIVGNVLMGGVILVMIGSLHYLVWGHAFSAEVAAEREALRRQDAREQAGPAADAIQEISRTPPAASQPDPPPAKAASDAIQDLSHTKGIQ